MEDKVAKLKKIYELALRGIDGEKEQALAMLTKLTKKYGLSIEDLDENTVSDYEMIFHGEFQKKILLQTVYKVTGVTTNMYPLYWTGSGRKCRNTIGVRCTELQKVEIEFLFDFYCRLWEQDVNTFMNAFIQKHRIFGELKDGEKPDEIPAEELQRMWAMAAGLTDEEPMLQIEG